MRGSARARRLVKMYEGTKHSFATDAVARGVPKEVVQKYLGHADPRSTDRYARLANTALLAVLPPAPSLSAPNLGPPRLDRFRRSNSRPYD